MWNIMIKKQAANVIVFTARYCDVGGNAINTHDVGSDVKYKTCYDWNVLKKKPERESLNMSPPSNKIDSRGRLYMLVYNLRHMRRWEKVFCSFLLGFVVSASTSKNLATFMDSFFMIFMYTIWLLISVPSLYKKLTAKFVKTFLYVVVLTFFADGLIFGLYRFLRRHLNDTEVYFDAVEQRGFIFVMNGIRLLFLAFCVLRSVTYTDIKAAKTPVKRNTRSSKRASGGRSKTPVRQSKTSWWSW